MAFMSRRLTNTQKNWSVAELEGYAVVEACNKFRHYLGNRHFKIRCDQNGFVQALSPRRGGKNIKNRKFARWRIDLAEFNFEIEHVPGALNIAADALSRIEEISVSDSLQLVRLRHEQFGHPGILRLHKLCQESEETSHIPSLEDKCTHIVRNCKICAENKPRWIKTPDTHVIESTEPWQRISIDFMVGKPCSKAGYTNILTIVDEYSRFPFAFPTKDRSSKTVISCLESLFHLLDHQYLSTRTGVQNFSLWKCTPFKQMGVRVSKSTPYNPTGNAQCERFNGIIWRTVLCTLDQHKMEINQWPEVLGETLHSIRSVYCTAIRKSPHEAFIIHKRTLPPIPIPGLPSPGKYAWIRKFVRSKNEPSGELVQVAAAYPKFAVVAHKGGYEIINWRHLAPHPGLPSESPTKGGSVTDAPDCRGIVSNGMEELGVAMSPTLPATVAESSTPQSFAAPSTINQSCAEEESSACDDRKSETGYRTRSGRMVKKPQRLQYL